MSGWDPHGGEQRPRGREQRGPGRGELLAGQGVADHGERPVVLLLPVLEGHPEDREGGLRDPSGVEAESVRGHQQFQRARVAPRRRDLVDEPGEHAEPERVRLPLVGKGVRSGAGHDGGSP
jgi:hypothetical protein